MEQDCLIRGVHSGMGIRAVWAEVAGAVNAAIVIHDADPAAATALAAALGASAAAAAQLDDGERFSIRFDYPGTLRGMLAEAAADGALRGLIFTPHPLSMGGGDASSLYGDGDGTLAVTRSNGVGRILNSGQTRAPLADPAADLGFYFSVSDQVETEIRTWAQWRPDPAAPAERFAVLMLQALPGCDLERFTRLRNAMHGKELTEFVKTASVMPDPGLFLASVLCEMARLAHVADCRMEAENFVLGAVPHWQCRCSREMMKRALGTLGEVELRKLFEERPVPHVECQFCRKSYAFRSEDFFGNGGKAGSALNHA